MEVTYVDISDWPRKKAGDLTSGLRAVTVIYALAICLPGLVFGAMAIVDGTTLRVRASLDPAPLHTRLLIAAALFAPTLIALLGAGWWIRSRRLHGTVFGRSAATVKSELRRLEWRLDRTAGYPRTRKLTAGRLMLCLAALLAAGTVVYAAAVPPESPGNRPAILMAGLASALGAGMAGLRILRPRRREARAAIQSWVLRAGGLLLFAGTVWASLIVYGQLTRSNGAEAPGGIALLVYALGCLLAILAFERFLALRKRADAISHPASRDVRRSDGRRPVLLLRSFPDDALTVAHEMESRWEEPVAVDLENTVARQAERYGPFIAVAEPGVGVTGGAARDRFTGDEWRTAVLGWMDEALLVTMVAGWTAGVQWELDQAVGRGHVEKLLIVLPGGPHLDARWRHVCQSFAGTPWHAALQGARVQAALAVYFGRNGQVYVIASRVKSAGHYEAAVETGIYGMLCREGT